MDAATGACYRFFYRSFFNRSVAVLRCALRFLPLCLLKTAGSVEVEGIALIENLMSSYIGRIRHMWPIKQAGFDFDGNK